MNELTWGRLRRGTLRCFGLPRRLCRLAHGKLLPGPLEERCSLPVVRVDSGDLFERLERGRPVAAPAIPRRAAVQRRQAVLQPGGTEQLFRVTMPRCIPDRCF